MKTFTKMNFSQTESFLLIVGDIEFNENSIIIHALRMISLVLTVETAEAVGEHFLNINGDDYCIFRVTCSNLIPINPSFTKVFIPDHIRKQIFLYREKFHLIPTCSKNFSFNSCFSFFV